MTIDGIDDVTDPWGRCAYGGKLYLGKKKLQCDQSVFIS